MQHIQISRRTVRALGRRLLTTLVILLAIAYLTQLGLLMAERGRQGVPAARRKKTIGRVKKRQPSRITKG